MSDKWGKESVPMSPAKWGKEPVLSASDDKDLTAASNALEAAAERLEQAGQAVSEAQEAVERAATEGANSTDA